MEEENVRLAQQIRFIRELRGFSQESIAQHLGISQQAYQKMESGKGRICKERMERITDFLSIDAKYLKCIDREDLLLGIRKQKSSRLRLNALKNELLLIQESIRQLNQHTAKILQDLELDQ